MTKVRQCTRCRAELDEYSPFGVCPRCLLSSGFDSLERGPLHPSIRLFGDYELLEEVARGGMGIVYRARQISLNRSVALKMILSGPFASDVSVERFRAEAQTAATLQHPNIVAIHEVGEHDGLHFFTMDFVPGRNLADLLREGPLASQRAAKYLKIIAKAIQYAHQEGILHRDLKPSNILIDEFDQPRITDFGLAKRLTSDGVLTVSGQVLGSPNFMPPEQAAGELSKIGPWSDVYSLGAILFHLLSGRPPFQGATMTATLQEVLNREPIPLRLLNRSVPGDLETICLKCLEKEPAKRYQTAEGLAAELGRFLDGKPIHARPVSAAEKAWRWCVRKPALASLLVLLQVVVALGLGGIVWQWRRAERHHMESEQNLYGANIHLGNEALEAHNLVNAREYLRRIAASPAQREMRGWEWRFLAGQAREQHSTILGRHESWVSALASSPDGKWLASIGEDGAVKLWDFRARNEAASWPAHPRRLSSPPNSRLHSIGFTPDSLSLFTAGQDKAIRLWSATSQQPRRFIEGLEWPAVRVAVSRDGALVACGGYSGQWSLWSLSNGPPALLSSSTSGPIVLSGLAFSADGLSLVIGGAEQPIHRDHISVPQSPRAFSVLEGSSQPLAISPDGHWLATAGADRHTVRLWAFPELSPVSAKQVRGGILASLAFSPESDRLAVGLHDGQIQLWEVDRESEPVTLLGHEAIVTGLAFTPDGRALASSSYDQTVRVWDISAAASEPRLLQHGDNVMAVGFSPDSRLVASVGRERIHRGQDARRGDLTLRLWDVETLAQTAAITNPPDGLSARVTFFADGNVVAFDDFKTLRFYEVPSLQPAGETRGRFLVYATNGGPGIYYTGRMLARRVSPSGSEAVLVAEPGSVTAVALSPDGRMLASAATKQNGPAIQLWDIRDGRWLGNLGADKVEIVCLAFSPDGLTLVGACDNGKLGVWDVHGRRQKALLRGHNGDLNWVTFSPDGRTIATCGEDEAVRLWNVARLQEIAVLHGHKGSVNSVAFSPDGQWLASGSNDGTIRLWHAPSSGELARAQSLEE